MRCVLVLTSYAAITVATVITRKGSTGKCEDGGNYMNRFIDEGNCAHVMVTGGTIANGIFKNGFFRNCVITNGTYTANNGNFVNHSFSKGGYNFNGTQGTVDKLPVIMGGTFRGGTFAPNITFANAVLENAELKYSGCIGVTFKNGTCEETSFTGQVVENGTFVNCKFNKLQFNEGNCSGGVFEGTTINGGKFSRAAFVNTTIRGGRFIRSTFKHCKFEQGSFDGGEFDTEKPTDDNVPYKAFSSNEFDRKEHSKIIRVIHAGEGAKIKKKVPRDTNTVQSGSNTTQRDPGTVTSGSDTEQREPDTAQREPDTVTSGLDTTQREPDTVTSSADTVQGEPETVTSGSDTAQREPDTVTSGSGTEQRDVAAAGGGDQATRDAAWTTTASIATASKANALTAGTYSKNATTGSSQPPEYTTKALRGTSTGGKVAINRSSLEDSRAASPNISRIPEMFEDKVAVTDSVATRSRRKRKKPIRLSTIEWLAITLPPLVIVIVLLCVSYRYIYKTGAEELPADLPVLVNDSLEETTQWNTGNGQISAV